MPRCRPVAAFKAMSATRDHPEVVADAPLCVLHGTDSFEAIQMPDGSRVIDCNTAVAAWGAQVKKHFPAQDSGPEAVLLEAFEPNDSTHPGDLAAVCAGAACLP